MAALVDVSTTPLQVVVSEPGAMLDCGFDIRQPVCPTRVLLANCVTSSHDIIHADQSKTINFDLGIVR